MDELKRCPHCGGEKLSGRIKEGLREWETRFPTPDGYYIECDQCKCRGPLSPSEDKAEIAWNVRM